MQNKFLCFQGFYKRELNSSPRTTDKNASTTTRDEERESGPETDEDELSGTDQCTATGKCCGSRYSIHCTL